MEDMNVIHSYLETQASQCFTILYERYAGKIYSKCISMLRDEALAQDATQEIFTKIFLNLAKFSGKSRFSTWIYSITYNYCIDYIRRTKKKKDIFTDDIEKAPDVIDDVPDEELLELEVEQLKKVLSELPPDDTAILLMKYQDGMSIKEISETLEKTESAVKMRIKRAKEKAKMLKSELFSAMP
ncbi:MAG: sigma-70 family RNA polymerase sigma factor [Bacteroidetes bacterium]|nr:MAG: sigma-70 family RNA polymerase sigma factor [Bacteroidota bacterium]